MAFLVDPVDTDDIGATIVDVISGRTHQPRLAKHVLENHSEHAIAQLLANSYFRTISGHHTSASVT